MKFLKWGKDGGPKSTVHGFWFVEIKGLFSIVLLRFDAGSREIFHSHAFNALTWWLSGEVQEFLVGKSEPYVWKPSIHPKYTPRSCFHKVYAIRRTWALSFRGPWAARWREFDPTSRETTILTHGRKILGVK